MSRQKTIGNAMSVTLDNARRFLKDSMILGKKGSIGHATSLAILGYEEAHKAYLIARFHPLFDEKGLTQNQIFDTSIKYSLLPQTIGFVL